MSIKNLLGTLLLVALFTFHLSSEVAAQDTQILGFVAGEMNYQDDQLNFVIGEQDLFITSQLNDNFSFLGETVFKFSPNSPTDFNVSVERIIVAYNYMGNHSVLFGKHHTPVNYWNDAYHHGRVFFPTISRPLLFNAGIIPIHTTGIAFQGLNLGDMRFGYNVMIGNGIGSTDVAENDDTKSITASLTAKPFGSWHFGASFYRDKIEAGTMIHGTGNTLTENTTQQLYTATAAHFGRRFELLAESTFALNDTESTGNLNSNASYVYGGVRLNEKLVPYFRYDRLMYDDNEQYFDAVDTSSIIAGLRYEVSFLIVLKMEYQYINRDTIGSSNILNTQIAIGF